jgi:hypothetical protein
MIEAARPQLSAASERCCRNSAQGLHACTSRKSYVKGKYCLETVTVDGSWLTHGWSRSTGEAIRWSTYGDCEAAGDSSSESNADAKSARTRLSIPGFTNAAAFLFLLVGGRTGAGRLGSGVEDEEGAEEGGRGTSSTDRCWLQRHELGIERTQDGAHRHAPSSARLRFLWARRTRNYSAELQRMRVLRVARYS